MRTVFRVDASSEIGAGHVMRCLALAAALVQHGHAVAFVCRALPGNLISEIQQRGFSCCSLNSQPVDEIADWQACIATLDTMPDWLVVDNYVLGIEWESAARLAGVRVLAIDDGGRRQHACHILLDHNLIAANASRYSVLAPGARLLLGPQYALLRPEFASSAQSRRQFSIEVRTLLVCFGGADPIDATFRTVESIGDLISSSSLRLHVVVGAAYQNIRRLRPLVQGANGHLWCQPPNLSKLYTTADLAIGGGGVSALERCAMGLPSIVMTIADNQLEATQGLAEAGALLFAGGADNHGIQVTRQLLLQCLTDFQLRQAIASAGMALVNVRGANLVVQKMETFC